MKRIAIVVTVALIVAVAAGLLDADTAEAIGGWCRKC